MIAIALAGSVIVVVGALAATYCYLLVKVTLLAAASSQNPKEQAVSIKEATEALQPMLTMLLSQTLFPLATIAIGWYFATRLSDRNNDK